MEQIEFTVLYNEKVVRRDIPALPSAERKRIQNAILEKLMTHTDIFGKALRKSLSGCRSLRVGDYRVIYRVEGAVVRIYVIGHRSVVYRNAERDIGA